MLTQLILHLPTWEMIRVLGISAYVMLFVGVSLGICYSMPGRSGKAKANLYKIHSAATVSGMFLGMFHAMLLVIDTYEPFGWTQILVPFSAADKPLFTGLGTIAAYGMVLIILTTDLRNKLNKKVWRLIHISAYPTFIAALIHGIGVGTDTKNGWVFLMYVATTMIVTVLFIIRAFIGGKRSLAHTASRG
ncbi:ferric reductase-like transmembrane domain-containing protein [Brevibacillus ginsengisoli]|uniref:ferric reductase-like transmembrane domain-containing protein n=1 Tax=Brevibacillus ginsengisoli TaxID=363854 RepID=UPI003CF3F5E9